MPTSFSTQNRINLMADGEQSGTWGSLTNTNWALIEQLSSTVLSKSVAGSADVTLTANNGASDEARNAFESLTGVLTGAINVIVPAQSRGWVVKNGTTGSFGLTFKPAGGTGLVLNQGVTTQVWTDGATMFPVESLLSQYHGQCKLTLVSATQLKLVCWNGATIRVSGVDYMIPSAGITANNTTVFVNGAAGQNLATSTLYYVYLFVNAGVLTFDYSTTAHATSTTSGNVGVEVKSGDDTRTYIGLIFTNSSNQFDDSAAKRNVASWFNAVPKGLIGANSSGTTTSGSLVEMNTAARAEFVVHAGDPVFVGFLMQGVQSNANLTLNGNVGIDSTTVGILSQNTASNQATTGVPNNISAPATYTSASEGHHFATLLMMVSGGTGSFSGSIQGFVRG